MVNSVQTTDMTLRKGVDTIHDGGDSYNFYSYDSYDFEYDEYMYPGFSFERPVYLYIWEILVITTFLLNVVVLLVFIRTKMCSPTIVILSGIAISDSLTGLVTLPAYIMVFQRYEPPLNLQSQNMQQTTVSVVELEQLRDHSLSAVETTETYNTETFPPIEGYSLTKDLCRGFMISKLFLSTSFHTMSIFLTLFLAIQRYFFMTKPFKTETLFSVKKTTVYCLCIFVITPFLHLYHLFEEKAKNGMCQWNINEKGCKTGCIYLLVALVIRHLLPCCCLLVFTILFIFHLHRGERRLKRIACSQEQISTRIKENRRVSIMVTLVVIVRLVPEITFSIFLLYNFLDKAINNGQNITLETNRIFHMSYEILLMLSFQSNFFIYMIFHRNFRNCFSCRCISHRTSGCEVSGNVEEGFIILQSLSGTTTFTNMSSVNERLSTDLHAVIKSLHCEGTMAVTDTLLDKVS